VDLVRLASSTRARARIKKVRAELAAATRARARIKKLRVKVASVTRPSARAMTRTTTTKMPMNRLTSCSEFADEWGKVHQHFTA
jgi:hypothetical protein